MEPKKTLISQMNLEKEQNWKYHMPRFQTIQQSYGRQNSMILAQTWIYRSMEENRKPRKKPTFIWLIFDKGGKYTMGER